MTPLHIDILRALHNAVPYGLALELLLDDMRRLRHRGATLPQVQSAVRDLADQSLVTPLDGVLSERWRITALGVSQLHEEGIL